MVAEVIGPKSLRINIMVTAEKYLESSEKWLLFNCINNQQEYQNKTQHPSHPLPIYLWMPREYFPYRRRLELLSIHCGYFFYLLVHRWLLFLSWNVPYTSLSRAIFMAAPSNSVCPELNSMLPPLSSISLSKCRQLTLLLYYVLPNSVSRVK